MFALVVVVAALAQLAHLAGVVLVAQVEPVGEVVEESAWTNPSSHRCYSLLLDMPSCASSNPNLPLTENR